MQLPAMRYSGNDIRNQTVEFRGLNRRNRAAEGEFADCGNLSFAEYPALSAKKNDSTVKNYAAASDIFEWNGQTVFVDGTSLLLDDEEIGEVMPGSKQFAVVNTKLIVWPDKVEYDFETEQFRHMERGVHAASGTYYNSSYIQFQAYKLDEAATKLSEVLSVGDRVTIWGLPNVSPTKEHKILAIDDEQRILTFDENSFKPIYDRIHILQEPHPAGAAIYIDSGYFETEYGSVGYYRYAMNLPEIPTGSALYQGSNEITVWDVVTGETTRYGAEAVYEYNPQPEKVIKYTYSLNNGNIINWPVKVQKGVPGMDFICSHNNRLYGVSNSANADEQTETTDDYKSRIIYVSALGMPDKFTEFEGVDTDSYSVAEASNGDFTGCCEYGDYVLFFKEHKVVKFYGDYPSNMGYSYDDIEGVKAGCHRSMVIANEVLYYMGRDGFYAYTGSVPRSVSYKLDREYEDVVCGTDGKRILLCGRVGTERELMEYQPQYGEWLRIGPASVSAMALINGKLHYLSGGSLMRWEGGNGAPEWYAEFHPWTEDTFKRKRWKYLRIRAEIEAGAEIAVKVKIGDHEEETLYRAEKTGWQTIKVPMPLMRTDRMVLTLRGTGLCTIHAIEREYQTGSDL